VASFFGHIRSQVSGAKAPAKIKEKRSLKIGLRILAVAIIATISASAYPQTAGSPAASAPGQSPELCVATMGFPPFVMEQSGSLTGIQHRALECDRRTAEVEDQLPDYAHPGAIEDAMRSKSADGTVAPVFIRRQVKRCLTFRIQYWKQPCRLCCVIPARGRAPQTRYGNAPSAVFPTDRGVLGIALLLVLIPAHLVWLIERRHEDGMISNRNYFPGILEAIYWAVSTLTT
jgi:polar amino acid transport system substrate-binding protein